MRADTSSLLTKRTFIKTSATALAASIAGPATKLFAEDKTSPAMPEMVVDTHTHFYDPQREGGVPWPQKNSPLYRPVLPDDWRDVAGPCGVTHTVIVEASPWVEDNQWILDFAEKDKSIVGFVGNLDPSEERFAEHLNRFAASPLFRGIRVSGKKFHENVDKPSFVAAMALLAEKDLSLDVNGGPPLLPAAAALAGKVKDLRIVIDHVGGAGDPANLAVNWREEMMQAAALPNIFCKVSGLPEQTKAEWGQARTDLEYYRPVLDHVWNCFGEDRVIYGSNWPVSDKGTSYEKMFAIVRGYFSEKGQSALEKYFYGNSLKAYLWVKR